MEYLHPIKKTTHAKEQAENRKINAETNSHGIKLSTRTNAFHQLFHPWFTDYRIQATTSAPNRPTTACFEVTLTSLAK